MENYYLLPFNFIKLNDSKELLTNTVGDYLFVPRGTVSKLVNKSIFFNQENDLYLDLLSNYIISEDPVHPLIDVLAVKYRTKKEFLNSFTGLHIFAITLRCDHKCDYCQVSRQSLDYKEYDMSFETIDKAIDLMLKSPGEHLTMEFQGGEPLLVFNKIKYSIEKVFQENKNLKKSISFVICTNLTYLTDDILSFCKEYNILISCSLDGPEFIHNFNRIYPKNSYESTIKGIKMAQSYLGKDRISALMTTTTRSLDYPKEIIDEYRRNNFNSIFLRPINPYGFALRSEKNRYSTSKFIEFYKRALNYIIELNLNGEFFIEDYARIVLMKVLTPFNIGFVDLQSPSGIISGVVVYNRDGKVYASDESRMLGEMGDTTFQLGDLHRDDYEQIFYGNKSTSFAPFMCNESLAGCHNCVFQTYCGADPVHNYATQGDLYGRRYSNPFCQRNLEIFKYLFDLIDKPEILKVFKSWVIK